jgi:Uncharacterised nucleotidyltransferase
MSSHPTRLDVNLEPQRYAFGLQLVAHNVLIDRLTAEVTSALHRDQIDSLVLKGPGLAKWLYPNEIRIRTDADLLIARQDKTKAVAVLKQLGFTLGYRSRLVATLPGDPGGVEYHRGCTAIHRFRQRSSANYAARLRVRCDTIDLHCSIPGLFGDLDTICRETFASSERLTVAGTVVNVPNNDFALVHVCLHAAQHVNDANCKAFEDLRRATAIAEDEHWCRALALARRFDGAVAFAAGLQCVVEGNSVARRLGLIESRSLRLTLDRDADAVNRRLAAILPRNASVVQALAALAGEIAPPPEYMRTWWPHIARRGIPGLLIAYMWRIAWAMRRVVPRIFASVHAKLPS